MNPRIIDTLPAVQTDRDFGTAYVVLSYMCMVHENVKLLFLASAADTTGGERLMFSGYPVGRPLTPILCDAISPYLVEGFQ